MIGTAICGFLVGMAATLFFIVRHGNPRADQLQKELNSITNGAKADAARHADEAKRFRVTSERFVSDRMAWRIDRSALESEIKHLEKQLDGAIETANFRAM